MRKLILILAAVFVFSGANSFASGVIFNPSFFYYTDKVDDGTTATNTTRNIINLKLGYEMDSGIYLGFAYDIDNKSVDNGTNTTTSDRTSYGGTLGYIYSNWQFLGTYYFTSKLTTGGSTYDGTGWVFDLGYTFTLSGNVGIGPMISYRSWTYTSKDGNSLNSNYKQSNILPSLELFILF